MFRCVLAAAALLAFGLPGRAGSVDAEPQARALLVGVGDPSSGGPWTPLSARRDLELLAAALADRGLSELDIRLLEGEGATAEGILDAIGEHLATASPGSTVHLHFSGHAEQIPDDGDDEPDGLDEAWVPAGATSSDPGSLLRDDAIGAALDEVRLALGPKGSLVVTVDACHGAGTLRGVEAGARAHVGVLDVQQEAALAPMVVLAASRSGHEAQEVTDGRGRPVGAFTAALADVLVAQPPAPSWAAAFARIRARMRALALGSDPVLTGGGWLPVLGRAAPPASWGLVVAGRLGDGRHVLEGGLLHGLDVGSLVELHRDVPEAPTPTTLLSVATVEYSGAATARVRPARPELPEGPLKAFLPRPASRLSLWIAPELDDDAMRRAARQSGVSVVGADATMELRLDGSEVVLAHRERGEVLHRAAQADVHRTVASVLRRLAAADRVLALPLDDEGLRVDVRLQGASVGDCAQTGEDLEPVSAPAVAVGETVRLEVVHAGELPAWVTVVHVDERGFGQQLAPLADAAHEPLAPGVRWVAPTCWTVTPPVAPQRLRVLATRRPAELGALLAGESLRALPPEGFAVDIELLVHPEDAR